jgi:hypothetical protein
MSLEVHDLGWMAAVMDLKARFLRKNNKDRSPHTSQVLMYVESVQTGVVRKLATLTGTKVELTEHIATKDGFWRRGCGEHCEEAHVHVDTGHFKPTMRWTITGASMATVLYNLAPYMLTEVDEYIDLGLRNTALRGRGSGAALGALRRLSGLGWKLPGGIILPEDVELEVDDDGVPELQGEEA